MKLHLLVCLCGIFGGNSLFAQSSVSAEKPTIWTNLFQDNLVEVNYKYADCNLPSAGSNNQNVYLQFKNKSVSPVTVNFKEELHYGSQCFNCDGLSSELNRTVSLNPGETKEGSCAEGNDQSFEIFVKRNTVQNGRVLSQFKIKEVSTSIVK